MDVITVFMNRLKKIGIELELKSNYPWIYLHKVNGNIVKEKSQSEHFFTVAYLPIKQGESIQFSDIGKMFKTIRNNL